MEMLADVAKCMKKPRPFQLNWTAILPISAFSIPPYMVKFEQQTGRHRTRDMWWQGQAAIAVSFVLERLEMKRTRGGREVTGKVDMSSSHSFATWDIRSTRSTPGTKLGDLKDEYVRHANQGHWISDATSVAQCWPPRAKDVDRSGTLDKCARAHGFVS